MNVNSGSRRWGGLIAVVVTLVLASAASGATAATLITGKQIKDNTVASVDIRDNALTSVDIKKGSVTGNDIENGSIGKADLAANATWNDLSVDGHILAPTIPGTSLISTSAECVGYDSRNTSIFGSLTLPVGSTITGFDATWVDESATGDVQIELWKRVGSSFVGVGVGSPARVRRASAPPRRRPCPRRSTRVSSSWSSSSSRSRAVPGRWRLLRNRGAPVLRQSGRTIQ